MGTMEHVAVEFSADMFSTGDGWPKESPAAMGFQDHDCEEEQRYR
jgi:hypothetical protein